jgi:hypothetical protein
MIQEKSFFTVLNEKLVLGKGKAEAKQYGGEQ